MRFECKVDLFEDLLFLFLVFALLALFEIFTSDGRGRKILKRS